MRNKLNKKCENKRGLSKIFLFGIILLIIASSLIIFVSSQSSEDLQSELNSLESELNNQGYSWLVNYIDINRGEI